MGISLFSSSSTYLAFVQVSPACFRLLSSDFKNLTSFSLSLYFFSLCKYSNTFHLSNSNSLSCTSILSFSLFFLSLPFLILLTDPLFIISFLFYFLYLAVVSQYIVSLFFPAVSLFQSIFLSVHPVCFFHFLILPSR